MKEKFTEKILSGEVPLNYRDPQEFMFGDARTEASDVYSYAMYIFRSIAGKEYFEAAGVPEDEFFMMADPDSESSVIDGIFIPEEYSALADILKKMTVLDRKHRADISGALKMLAEYENSAEADITEPVPEAVCEAGESTEAESVCAVQNNEQIQQITGRYAVEPDYDYGIIVNNKRSGRIEFRPLLFYTGKTESYSVPSSQNGEFVIAVSKRHRDYAHISNPSSVYGDHIIPVGLAAAAAPETPVTGIEINSEQGELKVVFSELSASGEKNGRSTAAGWR